MADSLAAELQAAYTYVRSLGQIKPAAVTCPVREYADIKKLMRTNSEGILFGGSLSQLDLKHRAISTIDFGKLSHILETADSDAALKSAMGPIVVNIAAGNEYNDIA